VLAPVGEGLPPGAPSRACRSVRAAAHDQSGEILPASTGASKSTFAACPHRPAIRKSPRARTASPARPPDRLDRRHPGPAARALGVRALLRRRPGDGLSGLGLTGRLPLRDGAGAAPRPGPLVEPLVLRRLPCLGLRRGSDQLRLALAAVLPLGSV